MREWYVYLAGPITGLSYNGCVGWREYVMSKFPPHIVGISPLRSKEYLMHEHVVKDYYDEHILSTGKAIRHRDHMDVHRCDLVFANFLGAKNPSIGSIMEIAWGDAYKKPVLIAMEPDNVHQHAMLRDVAGWIVPDLDEAIRIAVAIVSPVSVPVTH